jgi:glycosyltransferase involved in cell wall biosynthesis
MSQFLDAVEDSRLRSRPEFTFELLGAPGQHSTAGREWSRAAKERGLEGRVQFSGILSREDFSKRLSTYSAAVAIYDEGPTSRRTTLAAALSHGVPLIVVDGPSTWELLTTENVCLIVPRRGSEIVQGLLTLLDSQSLSQQMGERAVAFYDEHMHVRHASDAILRLRDLLVQPID